MVLPSAPNQISFNDIRIELNVPSQSPVSLNSASLGFYGAIQQCQNPFPTPTDPDAISEWYGYNHSATASLTISITNMDYSSVSCIAACESPFVGDREIQAYTRDSSNYYGNAICTSGLTAGFYADGTRTNCYTITGTPASITTTACNLTTTTTTSTTLATGTCYRVTNTNPFNSITVVWTSIDGASRSASLAASGVKNICSLTRPTESPAEQFISVGVCDPPDDCTNVCEDMGCTNCRYSC